MKKAKFAIVPEGNFMDLTAGKSYEILNWEGNYSFYIRDDANEKIFCLATGCAHLHHNDWILTTKN